MTLLLDALKCKNSSRPPVWLMRQAGRILPDYRALREKYSLDELFQNSELAAVVTKMPIDILGVDAAILFTDILVIAKAFGIQVRFVEGKGPVIDHLLSVPHEIERLQQIEVEEALASVKKTILLLKKELQVPLIGFCGAPFTVASYMVKRKDWYREDPLSFHLLLHKITQASIDYLKMQIRAGVDALQVFDSWADSLNREEFLEFSLPYMRQIVEALKESGIPLILFCRGSSLRVKELVSIQSSALSFDWHKEMHLIRKEVPRSIAVQGNLDPEILKAPLSQIEKSVERLLTLMKNDPGFIVNLGHGVLPDTPLSHVHHFVQLVKQSS